MIRGMHGFEGRAPLRTWIFGILVNQARRLAVREQRHTRSVLDKNTTAGASTSRDPAETLRPNMSISEVPARPPFSWGLGTPESSVLGQETLRVIEQALAELPEAQRRVVLLRDVEGMDPADVCEILGLTDGNQRVLLHRGRVQVRQALDRYLKEGGERPGRPGMKP